MNIIKNIATELKKYLAQDEIIWRTNRYGKHYPIDTEALRRRGNATTGENLSAVEMLSKGVIGEVQKKPEEIKGNIKHFSGIERNPVKSDYIAGSYESFEPTRDPSVFPMSQVFIDDYLSNKLPPRKSVYGLFERRQLTSEVANLMRNHCLNIMHSDLPYEEKKQAVEKYIADAIDARLYIKDRISWFEADLPYGKTVREYGDDEYKSWQKTKYLEPMLDGVRQGIRAGQIAFNAIENPLLKSYDFDEKMLSYKTASGDVIDYSKADPLALALWKKANCIVPIMDANSSGSYFRDTDGYYGVHMNKSRDDNGTFAKCAGEVLMHESAHNIDVFFADGNDENAVPWKKWSYFQDAGRNFSMNFESGAFRDALASDIKNFVDREHKSCASALKEARKVWISDGELKDKYVLEDYLSKELVDNHGVHDSVAKVIALDYLYKGRLRNTMSRAYIMSKYTGKDGLYGDRKIANFSDMLCANTEYYSQGQMDLGYGHFDKGYWTEPHIATEAFAEFFSSYMINPESKKFLNTNMKRSTKVFERMLKHLAGK